MKLSILNIINQLHNITESPDGKMIGGFLSIQDIIRKTNTTPSGPISNVCATTNGGPCNNTTCPDSLNKGKCTNYKSCPNATNTGAIEPQSGLWASCGRVLDK